MRPEVGNSSISMKKIIITLILYGFDQKNTVFLKGGLDSYSILQEQYQVLPFQQFSAVCRIKTKISTVCRVKTKIQKVLSTNSNVCRSYKGKPGRGKDFLLPTSSFHLEQSLQKRKILLVQKQLNSFCSDFNSLLNNINSNRLVCSVIVGYFDVRCSK